MSHNARVSARHFAGIIGTDHPNVSPPEMPVTSDDKPRGGRPATGRGVPYTFRSPETLKTKFIERAGERRAAAVLRQFMAAYVGEPGASMPKPPPVPTEEAA
jgi:hypothetical protein